MFARIRRGLTFANVCSLLALTIALGTGTAYAANTVFSEDIVNGEVKNVDIHGQAVGTGKLADNAVTQPKIADDAIGSQEIITGSVAATDLGSSSVGSDEIATDAVGASEVADNVIDGGEIVNDSLSSFDLAAGSVGASEIASSAVGTADVATNSLTTADIAGADRSGHVSLSGVPNGRCSNVDFGVSGAHVGEVPLVASQAEMQNGMVLHALRVSSEGHVRVAVCNLTGGSMTPIVDLPVRVITFG